MAQLKSVSDIVTEYHIEAETYSREMDERLENDPALASLNDEIRDLGVKKLERTMNGQSSELIDELMNKLDGRRQARVKALGIQKYRCDICRDTGAVDGRYCNCLRSRIYQQHYGAIDPLSWPVTLDTYDLTVFDDNRKVTDGGDTHRSIARLAWSLAKDIASDKNGSRGGLFLYGQPGLGKSYLVGALARQATENGIDTAFIHAVPLFQAYHRERLGEPVEMSHIETARLLILDDLGAEPITNNVTRVSLLRLLTVRADQELPTVVVTNQTELQNRYGERITSRLRSKEFMALHMQGSDIRDTRLW